MRKAELIAKWPRFPVLKKQEGKSRAKLRARSQLYGKTGLKPGEDTQRL